MNHNEMQELMELVSTTKSDIDRLVNITCTRSYGESQHMEKIADQVGVIKDIVCRMVSDTEQEHGTQSDWLRR